ncbi:MAG: hypothetical protein M1352_01725 [Patescibacteria group bacterium]|nr:hypothetical protein [Patescibacteria group bacterium]
MKTVLFVSFLIFSGLLLGAVQVNAAIPLGESGSPSDSCTTLWWRDSAHPICTQKKFCGAFLNDEFYKSVAVFSTQKECQNAPLPLGSTHQDTIVEKPQTWYQKIIQIIRSFLARFFPVWQANRQTPAPTPDQSAEGKFCGGIGANLSQNQCPSGYRCQLDGSHPDAGGRCVKSGQ